MQAPRRSVLLALAGMVVSHLPAMARSSASHEDAGVSVVPDIPGVQLAHPYADHIDPAPYLVSEKFDGVRALWDGQTLRFRSGRTVPAPTWFRDRLPAQALDGELWLGRGRFDEASGIVRKEVAVDSEWRQIRYMIFELPGAPGTFAERVRRITELARVAAWPQLVAVEHTAVADRDALQRRLTATAAQGGEGLMLHRASASVSTGRSDDLLKFKPSLDTEAEVVGHRPGKGKYAGQLGALEVQTPSGRRVLLGSGLSDALRRDPPPLGSVVTYRYRDLTRTGLPRFASFLRVHQDF